MDAITDVPLPTNEPVHEYAPDSPERARLVRAARESAEAIRHRATATQEAQAAFGKQDGAR